MQLKVIKYNILWILPLIFCSCLNVATEIKSWVEADSLEAVDGTYHFLEHDGIKIYLPSVFKKYSVADYQKLLDSLVSKRDYKFESERLKSMRKMNGNLYLYFDENSRSTYSINTMPYMPLLKKDAQYLLGIIKNSHEQIAEKSHLTFEKVTAKYSSGAGYQIFKAIYRISDTKTKTSVFNTSYILSSKDNTVFINLTTPFDIDFDGYLQKMIL